MHQQGFTYIYLDVFLKDKSLVGKIAVWFYYFLIFHMIFYILLWDANFEF